MELLIETRREEEVGVVLMNRPAQKNAMNTLMLEALIPAITAFAQDSTIGMVITGVGGVFSAGADIAEQPDSAGALRRMQLFADLYQAVVTFPKPSVAAISGACVGGGAEVSAGCDLRVATASARIRFPGAQFGIPIGSARLPLLVGYSHAKDLLMTARTVDGEEAFRMGLVNRLVEEDSLAPAALELVKQMAANPGSVTQKVLLNEVSMLEERTSEENTKLMQWQEGALK
ncbi:MAG TPA: enoyl-CoA hydratase/isomerase family protein [Actinomycetota bacterium]|nr:enoyl-CoA hydratase/isomerase family protein [Actinomycetota bacterium]